MRTSQVMALVHYRIQNAHEALRESQILLEASAFMGAVNRAYYAMFYALLAVLVANRLSTAKHSGAIALFDREFVKKGIFPKSLSRSLHIAFDRRQRHDYGEMLAATYEVAQDTLSAARIFVQTLESYLEDRGFSAGEEE